VGGSAARYFTPGNIPQLTDLISEVLTNPQLAKEMSDSGLAQAKKFTWHGYAQATASVYAKTLG
jgi:glycosyltransferase involved in cell wall biosynthesis